MSAIEVIEQIKKLPPDEWRKIRSFLDTAVPGSESVITEEFRTVAGKVFSQNEELFRKLAQ